MILEDVFTSKVMYILNDKIIKSLQELPKDFYAVVLGGKALNALLKSEYKTNTIDWDIDIFSVNPKYTNQQARDYLGKQIVENLKDLVNQYGFRLNIIESYYKINIIDIVYQVNTKPFTSIYGETYTIGHVDLITDKFGPIGIVDIVPIKPQNPGKYITFDGVHYLGLAKITTNLIELINTKSYKKKDKARKRLSNIRKAVKKDGLSCNFYRFYYKNEGLTKFASQLAECASNTVLGPLDPLVKDNRIFPKFNASLEDVKIHDEYYNRLPTSYKNVILDYTYKMSNKWNNQLTYNAFFPNDKVPQSKEINILQEIILNAPPTQNDMTVFMTNRYLIYPGKKSSNYDFKKDQNVGFYSFVSTTYDNYYNPYPFIDLFAPGVAYAIKIPKGSRVLIIGKNSKYGNEREVILPYNSTIRIDEVKNKDITYQDGSELWYQPMVTYDATLIDSPSKKTIYHVDISTVRNEQIFNELIKDIDYKYHFTKLWTAINLQ